jgi:hypothetical protein
MRYKYKIHSRRRFSMGLANPRSVTSYTKRSLYLYGMKKAPVYWSTETHIRLKSSVTGGPLAKKTWRLVHSER